jgi:hypothetical protein
MSIFDKLLMHSNIYTFKSILQLNHGKNSSLRIKTSEHEGKLSSKDAISLLLMREPQGTDATKVTGRGGKLKIINSDLR